MKKQLPNLNFELDLWKQGFLVCGMDEVGRGAFAGPLVVGAVVLKPMEVKKDLKWLLSFGVNDSKLVNPRRRKLIKELLQEYILFSTVQHISCDIINDTGIGKANRTAFSSAARAVKRACPEYPRGELKTNSMLYLTDAFKIPDIHVDKQKNIIRGDSTVFSIAAASIIAKVERDSYMERLDSDFPDYGFARHKGYGTKIHRELLRKNGPCPHHRTEFVKNYIFHV